MGRLRALVGATLLAVVLCPGTLHAAPGDLRLTVEAPPSLAPAAERIRRFDGAQLSAALGRAGLPVPPHIHIVLIAEDDLRARAIPAWIVGLASGQENIAIFPGRIGSYPYDSLESVVWHEIVHLALSSQAGDRALPRWFHEGVAMSVEKGWGVTDRVQLLFAARGTPSLADLERLFGSETQPETASAYLLASALVSDLRLRYGPAVPGAIVSRVARGEDFAAAFARETGETPSGAALRVWRSYGRWTSWIPVVASPSSLWYGILALAGLAFLVTLRKRRQRRQQWDEEEGETHSPVM